MEVTERMGHSLSVIQLSPHNVLLVMFGGRRYHNSARLSDTVLIELSEFYQYSTGENMYRHLYFTAGIIYNRCVNSALQNVIH